MDELYIRKALKEDIPSITKLLFQVHKVHSDVRPDLFIPGGIKYTSDELENMIKDDKNPIFTAVKGNEILGYAFCIHKQFLNDTSLTDVKTLYIDDLCVDENSRGLHVGKKLYEYVVDYASKNNCYNVTLNVWADNTNAVKFYEHIGLKIQKIGMEKIL